MADNIKARGRESGRAVASTLLTGIISQRVFIVFLAVVVGMMAQGGMNIDFVYDEIWYYAIALAQYAATMLPAVIVALSFSRKENKKGALSALLPSEKVGAGKFVCAVLSTYVFCMAGNLISVYIANIAEYNGLPVPSAEIPYISDARTFVLQLLIIAILPALVEELLVRGSVHCFCRQIGPFYCGLLSGIVFALFHCNLAQYPTAFMFGFITGYYVAAYRNIWIGITAHFINNVLACLYSYDGTEVYYYLIDTFSLLYIIASIVCFVVMLTKYKLFREKRESSAKGFFSIISSPTVIIFAIVAVIATFAELMLL